MLLTQPQPPVVTNKQPEKEVNSEYEDSKKRKVLGTYALFYPRVKSSISIKDIEFFLSPRPKFFEEVLPLGLLLSSKFIDMQAKGSFKLGLEITFSFGEKTNPKQIIFSTIPNSTPGTKDFVINYKVLPENDETVFRTKEPILKSNSLWQIDVEKKTIKHPMLCTYEPYEKDLELEKGLPMRYSLLKRGPRGWLVDMYRPAVLLGCLYYFLRDVQSVNEYLKFDKECPKINLDLPAKFTYELDSFCEQKGGDKAENRANEDFCIVGEFNGLSVLGVVDGHGGTAVAQHVHDTLTQRIEKHVNASTNKQEVDMIEIIKTVIAEIEQWTWDEQDSQFDAQNTEKNRSPGAVLAFGVLDHRTNVMYIAGVGDCHVISVDDKNRLELMMGNHNAGGCMETARIMLCGGFVAQDRACGVFLPGRVLGDVDVKKVEPQAKAALEPIVEMYSVDLNFLNGVIFATDGISYSRHMDAVTKFDLKEGAEAFALRYQMVGENGYTDDKGVVMIKKWHAKV